MTQCGCFKTNWTFAIRLKFFNCNAMTELCKFVTFEKAVWSSNYPSDVHYIFLNDYFSYKQCLCDKKKWFSLEMWMFSNIFIYKLFFYRRSISSKNDHHNHSSPLNNLTVTFQLKEWHRLTLLTYYVLAFVIKNNW